MSVINCVQSGPDIIQISGEIPVTGWTNSNNIYSYVIEANGVDEDMSVLALNFTNNSQLHQTAAIHWETQLDKVVLTTSKLPTDLLSYDIVIAG